MKSNKIYMAATIILIVGFLVFFVGFALAGFDLNGISTNKPYEEKSFVASDMMNSLTLDDRNSDISLIASPDGIFRITYMENDIETYSITGQENGNLAMTKQMTKKWWNYIFNFQFTKPNVRLEIPKDFKGNITVRTSNGSIDLDSFSASKINLNSSNGKINIRSVTAEAVSVDTSNGSITLTDVMLSDQLINKTSNGSITLERISCKDGDLKSSNGKIYLTDVTSETNLSAKTSNGRITLDTVQAGLELKLKNSNGKIEGTVKGKMSDYSIYSKTSNSSSNLPEKMGSGDKKLDAQTSNGEIKIDFIENH